MFIAPDARLDDGLLDVIAIADVAKWQLPARPPAVFKGEHVGQ